MWLFDVVCFYLRRAYQRSPLLLIFSAVSLSLFFLAAYAWLLASAAQQSRLVPEIPNTYNRVPAVQSKTAVPDLPVFHTVPLVNAIERSSQRSGMAVGEVIFSLDDTNEKPFIRYQATFMLVGGYPAMRMFLKDMQASLVYVSLDSVHCLREDIDDSDVGCTITMSAFYKRADRG